MIRHFGYHFGRSDVQDTIKAITMTGGLGGPEKIKEVTKTVTDTKYVDRVKLIGVPVRGPETVRILEKVVKDTVSEERANIAEVEAEAIKVHSAIVFKTLEKRLKELKSRLKKSEKVGKSAIGLAEEGSATILALIDLVDGTLKAAKTKP